ncbi:hypothetical protein A2U01_0057520, partial [Trifolium medium]|nr:hypothetical protein [Trifolium medium]
LFLDDLIDIEGEYSLTFVDFSFFTADLDFDSFFDSLACTVEIGTASAMIAEVPTFAFDRVA